MGLEGVALKIGVIGSRAGARAELVDHWTRALGLRREDRDGEVLLTRDRAVSLRILLDSARITSEGIDALVFFASAQRANAKQNNDDWRANSIARALVGRERCAIYFGDWGPSQNRSLDELREIESKSEEPVFWDEVRPGPRALVCLFTLAERALAHQAVDDDGSLLAALKGHARQS